MLPIGVNSSSKEKNFYTYFDRTNNFESMHIAVAKNTGNVYNLQFQNGVTNANSIVKTDKYGNFLWEKTIPRGDTIPWMSIDLDSSENIYISQLSYLGTNGYAHTIISFDLNGNYLWNRYFYNTTPASMRPGSIVVSSDNNYFYTSGYTGSDIYYVKFDLTGQPLVQRKLTLASATNWTTMTLDYDNNPILFGSTSTVATIAKYDQSGNLSWQRDITGMISYSISTDSDNNIFVAGFSLPSGGNGLGYLLKYNSSGVLQWQKSLTSSPHTNRKANGITSVKVDSDKNVYVYFQYNAYDPGSPTTNYLFWFGYSGILKFDTNGNYLWGKQIGPKYSSPSNFDQNPNYGMSIDKNNDLYITSNMYNNSGIDDAGFIKFSPAKQHNNTESQTSLFVSKIGISAEGSDNYSYVITNSALTESSASHTSADAGYSYFYFGSYGSSVTTTTINSQISGYL